MTFWSRTAAWTSDLKGITFARTFTVHYRAGGLEDGVIITLSTTNADRRRGRANCRWSTASSHGRLRGPAPADPAVQGEPHLLGVVVNKVDRPDSHRRGRLETTDLPLSRART